MNLLKAASTVSLLTLASRVTGLVRDQLIAAGKSVEQIRQFLGVDSLAYLSQEGMLSCVHMPGRHYCTHKQEGSQPSVRISAGRTQSGRRSSDVSCQLIEDVSAQQRRRSAAPCKTRTGNDRRAYYHTSPGSSPGHGVASRPAACGGGQCMAPVLGGEGTRVPRSGSS